jgi:hypothetical protein
MSEQDPMSTEEEIEEVEEQAQRVYGAVCRLLDMIDDDFGLDDDGKFWVVFGLMSNTANRLNCPETANMNYKQRQAYWFDKYHETADRFKFS